MKPLIIISGPTACGKTDIAIELCKALNTEAISADSMQVYKFMDIGTAKPTIEEMGGIKHHLIDSLFPDEEFSVAIFQKMATKAIEQMALSDKIPVVVGGTGFFINALVYNNNFVETNTDYAYRSELENIAKEKGNLYVHEMLKKIDAESAETIHPNNVKRVIRAIEYYKQTGSPIAEHNKKEKARETFYDTVSIVLNQDRVVLYERINDRVDLMIKKGLIEEVENLLNMGYHENLVSMQGIGYKEMVKYLHNEVSKADAIDSVKQNSRNYAKRQVTWFKHQSDGFWINVDEIRNKGIIVEMIQKNIEQKLKPYTQRG